MNEAGSQVGVYDPALAEVAQEGDREDEIAVLARLTDPDGLPEGVQVVTRFGDVVTLRLRRDRAAELAESACVTGLEATHRLRLSTSGAEDDEDCAVPGGDAPDGETAVARPEVVAASSYTRRPPGVTVTGKGCVVGVLDWGCDFAHPAFRNEDGSSRLLALWDQRGNDQVAPDNRWGYGRVFTRDDINRALRSADPYGSLNYDPSVSGGRKGAHGTHVLDIAAGSGLAGGMPGVAPEADLIFVHLSRTTEVLGRGNLGDSATVLEALDFVFSTAGDRPCAVNMSVGAQGASHDGLTLLEQGIDRAVSLQSGRAVVCSAGNYFRRRHHTQGHVEKDGEKVLPFVVPAGDPTDSELEVWYPGIDRFTATVVGPSGAELATVGPGQDSPLASGSSVAGHIYHYARQALNGDHHIDLFLRPRAPGGTWELRLKGDVVHNGRYDAWIERDRGLQPKFLSADCVTDSTTGTLCNGKLSITVGACDPHDGQALGVFSSAGPTRDGRIKPEIVAPGVRIRAARSTPPAEPPGARYTIKSGTSMAAPHVAGAIACMFEAAQEPLEICETRALLFASADRTPFADGVLDAVDLHRYGYGLLDIAAAERAAREWGRSDADEDQAESAPNERNGDGVNSERTDADLEEQDGDGMDTQQADSGLEEWDGEDTEVGQGDAEQAERDIDAGPDINVDTDVQPSDVSSFPDVLRDVLTTASVETAEQLRRLALSAMGVSADSEFVPVGKSGTVFDEPVRPGDLLERSAPLEGVSHSAVVISESAESAAELANRGVPVEWAGAGAYVEVIEIPFGGGPARVGRRLTDAWGRLPRGQTVLRGVDAGALAGQSEEVGSAIRPAIDAPRINLDNDIILIIVSLQRPGDVGNYWGSHIRPNRQQWTHALSELEEDYIVSMTSPNVPSAIRMRAPVNPNNMTPEERSSARRLFGTGADAPGRYANYENRRRITAHYVWSHPATVRLQLGLYRLARDINPLHFALERGWQIGSGREMFTGREVSRLGAALEFTAALALVYGIGRVLRAVRPPTGSPRPPARSLGDPIWDLPPQGGGMRINSRWYTEHALERMAPNTPQVRELLRTRVGARLRRIGITPRHPAYDRVLNRALRKIDPRGVPPSVVEAEIVRPGSTRVRVITAQRQQVVVTVLPRRSSGGRAARP